MLRRPAPADVPRLKEIRMAVAENRLSDPSRVPDSEWAWYVERGESWVWDEGGRVLGFAMGDPRDGHVEALFVDPAAERRGIGRALLERTCAGLRGAGHRVLTLHTQPGSRAEAVYRAAGWTATGSAPNGDLAMECRPAPVTYGAYLRLDELLALQSPLSGAGGAPEHPDELLFIVVHQASELWFKVLRAELDALHDCLAKAAHEGAAEEWALWRVQRLNTLTRIVSEQLTALDALPPQRFLQFRGFLGTSSGSQSVQFRAIEAASGLRDPAFLATAAGGRGGTAGAAPLPEIVAREVERPTLERRFLDVLEARGVPPEALYTGPAPTTLFFLAEGLLEYEQQFARWRFAHVQLVERIIGPMTGGTGGSLGAGYLARTVSHRFFPVLWEVRQRLYGAARAAAGGQASTATGAALGASP